MNFSEVFTKDFLFNWQGRINRKRYWTFALVCFGLGIVAGIGDGITGSSIFTILLMLTTIYPSIIVGIKRWHDRDKSGWWTLIGLVPVVGFIWVIVECGFLKGTEGPNRFGPDPLGGA